VERERHREEVDRSEEVVGDEGSGEEEVDDEIDIVVEEDGQVIKISPEELKNLRREFEENRRLESSPSNDLKVENEEKGLVDGKKLQEVEEGRSDVCRDNLDSKYAEKVDKTYLCKVCSTVVSSRRALESHVSLAHTGLAVFRCGKCHKTFTSDVGLLLHLQNHHPAAHRPLLSCSEPACSYSTRGPQLLRAHRRQHLAPCLQCPVCKATLTGGRRTFRHHMKLHAGDRGFGCDKCDKKFVSQSRLTYHKTTVHDPPRFQCDQCSKLFRSKVNFGRHLLVHTAARPHTCHVCQATFRTPGHLTSHVQTVHRWYNTYFNHLLLSPDHPPANPAPHLPAQRLTCPT